MSNAESKRGSQTPRQETMDRLLESIPPALGIPRLLGIEHLQGVLSDARARVKDSHRVQMKIMGEKPEELAEGDDMGISVAGDTTINITAPTPEPPKEPPKAVTMTKKVLPTIGALALAGALPLLGFVAAKMLEKPSSPPTAAGPEDSAYDVLFYDRDGNLIDIPRKPK